MVRNNSNSIQTTRYLIQSIDVNSPVSDFLTNEYIRLKLAAKENMDCAVCLSEICCDKCFVLLNCGHNFHLKCISKITICPLCRS